LIDLLDLPPRHEDTKALSRARVADCHEGLEKELKSMGGPPNATVLFYLPSSIL